MTLGRSRDVRLAFINCETALGQALIAMFRSLESELIAEGAPCIFIRIIEFRLMLMLNCLRSLSLPE